MNDAVRANSGSVTVPLELGSPIRIADAAMRHVRQAVQRALPDGHVEVIGYDCSLEGIVEENGTRVIVEVTVEDTDPIAACDRIISSLAKEWEEAPNT